MEGWKFLGDPKEFSQKYYQAGIDEIIYLDSVASLYNRDILKNIVAETTKNVFIPITAGGGVRSVDDAYELLRAGADKIAINTAAVKDPGLISGVAGRFGAQCMVLYIEAKKVQDGKWEAYIDNGRQPTGLDVLDWVKRAVKQGAGEILLTSVDRDGTGKGFDVDLVKAVTRISTVPVIASGGMGKASDLHDLLKSAAPDAVAIAKAFHYNQVTVEELRKVAIQNNFAARTL